MAQSTGIRFDPEPAAGPPKSALRKSKDLAAVTEALDDVETGSVELRESDYKKKQARSHLCLCCH